ncbi:MAG: leucine-rich repeat domain-containing protein [Bacteroidetes bacterium]|nr:MAG: leucine-rich repeat domain-containing protein [Bacteroidota bacterium]
MLLNAWVASKGKQEYCMAKSKVQNYSFSLQGAVKCVLNFMCCIFASMKNILFLCGLVLFGLGGVGKAFAQPTHAPLDSATLASKPLYKNIAEALQAPDQVYKLNLSDQQLTAFPAEIQQFRNLQILLLHHNRLPALPAWVGKLQNLQTLNCSHNLLQTLPTELQQLKHLRYFLCSHNQLAVLPAWVGKFRSLRTLACSHNALLALPTEIGKLRELKLLFLSHNLLETLPNTIGKLKKLQVLQCDVNRLQNLPESIKNLQNLTDAIFAKNKFSAQEKTRITRLLPRDCMVGF